MNYEILIFMVGFAAGIVTCFLFLTFVIDMGRQARSGGYQPTKGDLDNNNPPRGGTAITPPSSRKQ